MDDYIKDAEAALSAEKLTLAAKNLQHYLKIQDEQITLETLVRELRATLPDGRGPESFSETLTLQAQILDAVFGFYMDSARESYASDDKVRTALKAQRQAISTVNALRHLHRAKLKNGGTD